MEIQGTAYWAAYAISQGYDPTTWTVPATVPVYVENDSNTQIGTATLTQQPDGTITLDAVIQSQYVRWARVRPYAVAALDGGSPETVTAVGIWETAPDPALPQYTVVTP